MTYVYVIVQCKVDYIRDVTWVYIVFSRYLMMSIHC